MRDKLRHVGNSPEYGAGDDVVPWYLEQVYNFCLLANPNHDIPILDVDSREHPNINPNSPQSPTTAPSHHFQSEPELIDVSVDPEDDNFVDSDYEQSDGQEDILQGVHDDDLLAENVDDVEEDHVALVSTGRGMENFGFGDVVTDSEESDELRSLDGSSSDDDSHVKRTTKRKIIKYTQWRREIDLKDPKFMVGLMFANPDEFREAVREYAIKQGKTIKFVLNEGYKLQAQCELLPAGKEIWCKF